MSGVEWWVGMPHTELSSTGCCVLFFRHGRTLETVWKTHLINQGVDAVPALLLNCAVANRVLGLCRHYQHSTAAW